MATQHSIGVSIFKLPFVLFDDFESAIERFQGLARDAADGSEEARQALDGEELKLLAENKPLPPLPPPS